MIVKYCKKCQCRTSHIELKKTGFLMQCLVAVFTKFQADLRESDLECICCGNKSYV